MSNEIVLGVIERVKNILQIDTNNSPLELLQLLRKHRNNFHPDKFTDEKAKGKAEKKFVEIGTLIQELDSFIQQEQINKSPMELALYQPLYDNTSLQSKLDLSLEENKELNSKVDNLQNRIKDLENELKEKESKVIEEKQTELVKLYRPSNNRLFSITILLALTGLIPVLTKIESISNIIRKYAPFTTIQINTFMFTIFVGVIVFSLGKYLQYIAIKNRIDEIKSPIFQTDFFEFLPDKNDFTEYQVYIYIYGKKNVIKRTLLLIGFKLYKPETINHLKDVFIHNLIVKQLIEISYAENLDRRFHIKSKPRYHYEVF